MPMIYGTICLSFVFITGIIISILLDWQNNSTKWLVFETIIHVCHWGAVVLEAIVSSIMICSVKDNKISETTITSEGTTTDSLGLREIP